MNAWTVTGRQMNRAFLQVGDEAGLSDQLAPFRHLEEDLEFPSVELMRLLSAHDKTLIEKGLSLSKKIQRAEMRAERRTVRRRGYVMGFKAFFDGGRSLPR